MVRLDACDRAPGHVSADLQAQVVVPWLLPWHRPQGAGSEQDSGRKAQCLWCLSSRLVAQSVTLQTLPGHGEEPPVRVLSTLPNQSQGSLLS
jgi:hypothetical protein